MNFITKVISIFLVAVVCLSFSFKNEIGSCYISFKMPGTLTATEPDKLPESSKKARNVPTEHGDVAISRIDGYRVLYNNEKNAPFVNLKVELSENGSYEKDKLNLIA